MDPFLLDILRDSKYRSDENRKLKCTDVDLQGKTADLMSCKNCNRRFKLLNQHLAQKATCKLRYTEEEIKAITSLRTSEKKRRYKNKKKKQIAQYNATYYKANRKELVQKKAIYNKKNQIDRAAKQKVYNDKHRNKNRPPYRRQSYMDMPGNRKYIKSEDKEIDWSKEDWCEVAGQELLQDEPNYIKFLPDTWRRVMYMDPEQLADNINRYKMEGHPEYQDVIIDYGYMSHTLESPLETDEDSESNHMPKLNQQFSEINLQKSLPQYSDIGLSNTVVVAGDMFNGKKVKEDINVITKLRTLSSQRYPEREDGSSWAFDPDHLIQAVRHWKMKNHICLRGIRFPDIVDVESTSSMTEKQRRDNEEKVIKSWKYFTSKPSDLLARYHKSFLEELGFSDEEEFEEWWNSK